MGSSRHNQQNQWSCPSLDSEFYSVSSPDTVSPDSSMEQGFSLSYQVQPMCSKTAEPPACPPGVFKKKRRLRLKNPSEQRQNTSEKEKLRMRDLTKALHHLRTYLPPSVAPVGQTLTKIETLRLTIRYISFLSAQLGHGVEELDQSKQMKWDEMKVDQYNGNPQQHSMEQNYSPDVDKYLHSQQCAQTTQSYQVYSRNVGYQLVQAYWS